METPASKMGLPEHILGQIIEFLSKIESVEQALIYGSRARARTAEDRILT